MKNSELYFERAKALYRQLHRVPELGFDLPKTVAIVKSELSSLGIAYTEKYGKSSVVADLGKGEKTVALRADMDALPVEEKTDLPFASEIPGRMHACGHDVHTAILLSVAAYLKSVEEQLPLRVRLIFQPSEECNESGARMMVENGVMNGVDHIICTHCENTLESGKVGVYEGDYMAACVPLRIRFLGKTAHAALRENGVDAIAMSVCAYRRMEEAVASLASGARYIWSVGRFSGGKAHNVVSDCCEMDISFRFFDLAFAERVRKTVYSICEEIAGEYGGRVEIKWQMTAAPVHNDAAVVKSFVRAVSARGIEVEGVKQRMSSEDFAWYLTRVKGMLFRLGTKNESKGCTALVHCNDFKIDEDGIETAIKAFVAYIREIAQI